jgi:hypothetical protein
MFKRLLLLLLLSHGLLLAPGPYDFLLHRILEIEKHWNPFIRQAFGCPPEGETTVSTCNLARSKINYYEMRKSREAFIKLFEIKECRSDEDATRN